MLGIPGASACFQSLDPTISSGANAGNNGSGSGTGNDGGGCQNGYIVDPSTSPVICTDQTGGNPPVVTQTPGIELPDGSTTDDPGVLTELQSIAIRQAYCVKCHGTPGIPAAPFHNILDDELLPDGGGGTLLKTLSVVTKDTAGNYVPLIVPGDPDHSYLYQRVAQHSMPPPPASLAAPANPMPNLSEIQVLRSWIMNCLQSNTASGDDGGPGGSADDGGGSDGAGSDDAGSEGGGGSDDAGTDGAGGSLDGGTGGITDGGRRMIRDAGRG